MQVHVILQTILIGSILAKDNIVDRINFIDYRNNSNGRSFIKSYITNGKTAARNQIPYQAGLEIPTGVNTYFWCGGSVIGHEWILSAKHCTQGKSLVYVYLGSNKRAQGRRVKSIKIHDHPTDDITLIKIPSVTFTDAIKPVPLPKIVGPTSNYYHQYGIASGWGQTASGKSLANLQYVFLYVISNEKCSRTYGPISADTLCTETEGGYGTCLGDSGGPLVTNGELIGVTRWVSANGCTVGDPAGFARVTYYLEWIRDIAGIAYY